VSVFVEEAVEVDGLDEEDDEDDEDDDALGVGVGVAVALDVAPLCDALADESLRLVVVCADALTVWPVP
jgi:hypothetical protein